MLLHVDTAQQENKRHQRVQTTKRPTMNMKINTKILLLSPTPSSSQYTTSVIPYSNHNSKHLDLIDEIKVFHATNYLFEFRTTFCNVQRHWDCVLFHLLLLLLLELFLIDSAFLKCHFERVKAVSNATKVTQTHTTQQYAKDILWSFYRWTGALEKLFVSRADEKWIEVWIESEWVYGRMEMERQKKKNN